MKMLNVFDYIEQYINNKHEVCKEYILVEPIELDNPLLSDAIKHIVKITKDIEDVILYIDKEQMRDNIEYHMEEDKHETYHNIVVKDIFELARKTGCVIARPYLYSGEKSFTIEFFNSKEKIMSYVIELREDNKSAYTIFSHNYINSFNIEQSEELFEYLEELKDVVRPH